MQVTLQKSISILLEQLRANRHHLKFGFAPDKPMLRATDNNFWIGCNSTATTSFQSAQIIKAIELLERGQVPKNERLLAKAKQKLECGDFSYEDGLELVNLLEILVQNQVSNDNLNLDRIDLLRKHFLNHGLGIEIVDIQDDDFIQKAVNATRNNRVVEIDLKSISQMRDWNRIISFMI